jgi:chromosome segregation ATPase
MHSEDAIARLETEVGALKFERDAYRHKLQDVDQTLQRANLKIHELREQIAALYATIKMLESTRDH